MQVAVTGVKDIAHLHVVSNRDFVNGAKNFRQPRARNDGVLHHQRRRDTTHCAERLLASLPEPRAFVVGRCHTDVTRAALTTTVLDGCHVVGQTSRESVHFTQEDRCSVDRIACRVDRCLDRADRRVVHHLKCGRNNAGRDDRRHSARGAVDARKVRENRAHGLRQWYETNPDTGRDPEAAFGPDEDAEQIVAIAFAVRIAEAHSSAIGENDIERDDVVEGDAVLEAVRTTRVFGDVATDRAHGLAGRIWCVLQSMRCDGTRQLRVDDTGFDVRNTILRIDFDDARQPIESEYHDVIGERTAGEARAGTPWHKRHTLTRERTNDPDHFVLRARKNRQRGQRAIAWEPVCVEGHKLSLAPLHPARADDRFE